MRSSYADLQQLKAAPAIATGVSSRYGAAFSPLNSDTTGDQHRSRKGTLNDGVPVVRIGEIDRDDTFEHATDDLNEENEKRKHS